MALTVLQEAVKKRIVVCHEPVVWAPRPECSICNTFASEAVLGFAVNVNSPIGAGCAHFFHKTLRTYDLFERSDGPASTYNTRTLPGLAFRSHGAKGKTCAELYGTKRRQQKLLISNELREAGRNPLRILISN